MFKVGDSVTIDGWGGVAWRIVEREQVEVVSTFNDDFGDWLIEDIELVDGENWICHMVGDNGLYSFGEDEMNPLDEDNFCSSCGQIGCCHG